MITLSQLFDKSKSFVGVFAALYSNLIDATAFGITDGTNTYSIFLNAVINVAYCAALLVPLLVLVVVLMGRVIFLWVIIAISPLIILLNVFKDTIKIEAFSGEKSYFSLKNI
jgi:hypothetical protein